MDAAQLAPIAAQLEALRVRGVPSADVVDVARAALRRLDTAQVEAAATSLRDLGLDVEPTLKEPDGWREWLEEIFPGHVSKGFAPHHADFWEWVWSIDPGETPAPHVGIWPREGGKTTGMELAVAALMARGRRRFCLYVCAIQAVANMRLQGIAAKMAEPRFSRFFPELSAPRLNARGNPTGYRQDFLHLASGQIIVPVGLDTAISRGLNVESFRPDLCVMDDIDDVSDTPEATAKKVRILTRTVLPAGGDALAVAFVQNLILPNGVAAQLADHRADFLVKRRVSGPIPSIRGLKTDPQTDESGRVRDVIVAGEPTWDGQGVDKCQELIDREGLTAFLRENQHEVKGIAGALLRPEDIRHVSDVPRDKDGKPAFVKVAVGVDAAGGGDDCGIVCEADAGPDAFPRFYVWKDRTTPTARGPSPWARAAVELCAETGAVAVAETNYGGNMVTSVLESAAKALSIPLRVEPVSAKMDKLGRAQPWAQSVQKGETVFVGALPDLEAEATTWVPKPGRSRSPNRLDAVAHAHNHLAAEKGPGAVTSYRPRRR